jgi:phosphoserine phosphatase
MKAHNATTALVSGGFTFFTGRVAEKVGFDIHRANTLLDDGEALTGQTGQPILDRYSKLEILRELAEARGVQMSATLAVGDGANDLDMIREAGLGIAYHAKPIVASEAKARVDFGNLRALLFAQGYKASQFVS